MIWNHAWKLHLASHCDNHQPLGRASSHRLVLNSQMGDDLALLYKEWVHRVGGVWGGVYVEGLPYYYLIMCF